MTPEEEIAGLKSWNALLVQKHDLVVKDAKGKEYQGRKSAFEAGLFSILFLYLLGAFVDHYGFDGEMDAFLEANKWATFLAIGLFTGCWKGMKYLAVDRHKPKDETK